MDRAGKTHFALDIDHSRLSERHRSGYARRPSKGVAADVEHRKPIDLTHARPFDVRRAYLTTAILLGKVHCFARQVVDRLHHRQQPTLFSRQASTEADDARKRLSVERLEPLLLHQRAQPGLVMARSLDTSVTNRSDFGLDLEQPVEVRVVEAQEAKNLRPSQQDHFGANLERIGP